MRCYSMCCGIVDSDIVKTIIGVRTETHAHSFQYSGDRIFNENDAM
jgi:hypothetical protein